MKKNVQVLEYKIFLVKKTLHFCQSKIVSRKEGIVQVIGFGMQWKSRLQ